MKTITKRYIGIVLVTALAVTGWMYFAMPSYGAAEVKALALLSALAILSETLAYALAREGRGSIAFIPYLAGLLLVPSWISVVTVGLVKLLMELLSRVDYRKAIFNASGHALTIAVAIGVYVGLGGKSLLESQGLGLSATASVSGLIAISAFGAAFLTNTALVSIAMSLESETTFMSRWKQTALPQIGGDLMATPLVFSFAWVYAHFGPMAAAICWVPFLGLRYFSLVNIELQRTNEELLQLMVKSIEARDPYTSGHSRRVSKYAVAIAKMLGRTEKEVKDIETAALLHDVGKIYEKYGPILASPTRLSASQWVIMQEHPIDGANLVATITRMRHLVPFVRHHHENWDGTGYPDRIGGDDIPLASRIIMFADTIDAMTTERPYRRPLTEADVCAELMKCRGKQFDPAIADQLLAAGVWKTLFGEARSRGPKKLELVVTQTA
jgi:putative nucleotidyltransferase with HDIG domain